MIGRKNVDDWIGLIEERDAGLLSRLASVYGRDKGLVDGRFGALLQMAAAFRQTYGRDREITFVRAPGRLNTLGMHIDHRGGFVNPIAINREAVLCYATRTDDLIRVRNLDGRYGERSFNISREAPTVAMDSVKRWLAWTQEQTNIRKREGIDEDWVNKLKAVPIYLQALFPDTNLLGFDGVLGSDIPVGMGLSSSSAIVVTMMDAMLDVNHIALTDDQFVNYCGIAEWFVGTRGGSGDHGAIKCGRAGMITHLKTLPRLLIKSYLPFPQNYRIVMFNSGIVADKTGPARQKFNEKTATYEIGEIFVREYLKRHHEGVLDRITGERDDLSPDEKKFYLADMPEHFSAAQIYELLESLPERVDRKGLLAQFPEHRGLLRDQFATHREPEEGYQVRSVVTYGVAECDRSRMLEDIVGESRIDRFGQLMTVSHDGDRVLFESVETRNKKRTLDKSQELCLQPGGYDCSVPEIDRMVDLALESGAEGAQISGAGLGGSMMVLVKDENLQRVVEALRAQYYAPRDVEEEYIVLSPVQGAGQL